MVQSIKMDIWFFAVNTFYVEWKVIISFVTFDMLASPVSLKCR